MEIKWSVAKTLSDEARDHAIPLVQASQRLAAAIRERVASRGESADGGTFRPYSEKNRDRTRAARDARGRFTGRRESTGPRTFYKSGQLWDSLEVRVTDPSRARVMFRGRRANHGAKNALTNPQVAWLQQRDEPKQILAPNDAERAQFVRDLAELAPAAWLRRTPEVRANHRQARREASVARAQAKAARLAARLASEGVPATGAAA